MMQNVEEMEKERREAYAALDAIRQRHNGYDPDMRAAWPYLKEPATPMEALDELLEEERMMAEAECAAKLLAAMLPIVGPVAAVPRFDDLCDTLKRVFTTAARLREGQGHVPATYDRKITEIGFRMGENGMEEYRRTHPANHSTDQGHVPAP